MRWAPLAVLLLAGCLGGPSSGPVDTGTSAPTTGPPPADPTPLPDLAMLLAFGYEDCQGVMVQPSIDLEAAQAALPDGYVAWQGGGALGAVAVAQYLWAQCTSFATQSATLDATVYGHVALRIEPPADAVEADEHWYRFRMLTAPGVLQSVWQAASYDVYAANFTRGSASPAPLPLASPVESVAVGAYSIDVVETRQEASYVGSVAHYTDIPAGRLEWVGTVDLATVSAAGQLHVPADDPLGQHLDAVQAPVTVAGDFSGNDLWLKRSG